MPVGGLGRAILASPSYWDWFGGGGYYPGGPGGQVGFYLDPEIGGHLPTSAEMLERNAQRNAQGGIELPATLPALTNSPVFDQPGGAGSDDDDQVYNSPPIVAPGVVEAKTAEANQANQMTIGTIALIVGGVLVLRKLIGG